MAASVEAYVQTKAAITTFRLAAKYTRTKSLSKLPEEIKERIAVIVRDTSFRRNMRQWTKIYECLSGRCNIESHFKKEKIKRAAYRHQRASETGEIDPLTWHRLRMEHYCNVLAPNSSSTLRKCVQVRLGFLFGTTSRQINIVIEIRPRMWDLSVHHLYQESGAIWRSLRS